MEAPHQGALEPPRIGGVRSQASPPVQFTEVPDDVISRWIPRKHQIAMVELLAVVVALETFAESLKDKFALWFVDSEPVQGALIKGYSAKDDVCELVGVVWQISLKLRVNIYLDRVPTDMNPSDFPSRNDLETGNRAGWITVEPRSPVVVSLGGLGEQLAV